MSFITEKHLLLAVSGIKKKFKSDKFLKIENIWVGLKISL